MAVLCVNAMNEESGKVMDKHGIGLTLSYSFSE